MNYNKQTTNHDGSIKHEFTEYSMNHLIEKMARMTIKDNAAEVPAEVPAEVIVLNDYYIVCG